MREISQAIAPEREEEFIPSVGVFRIHVADRDDGGLRIWSDDVPGLVLSSLDRAAVWRDLGPAMEVLIRRNLNQPRGAAAQPSPAVTEEELAAVIEANFRVSVDLGKSGHALHIARAVLSHLNGNTSQAIAPVRRNLNQPRGLSAAEEPNSSEGVNNDYDPSRDM